MYRIVIALKDPQSFSAMNEKIDWFSMNFHEPMIVSSADEAINLMETRRVDCIAYIFEKYEASSLKKYLSQVRPSLPIFQIKRDYDAQIKTLKDLLRYLDRLHSDCSDEVYDENVIMDMLRDELGHNLLAGELHDEQVLRGRLQMLRSYVSADKKCVLYDFDMPQGEVYLMNQWHYGSERLENALRNNFFGRYYDDIYYFVAVLTPRHIRVLACQRKEGDDEEENSLLFRTNMHINQSIDEIKSYLGLDLNLADVQVLANPTVLTQDAV